jgi:hypothetical protein
VTRAYVSLMMGTFLLAAAAPAVAQTTQETTPPTDFRHATTLSGFAGAAVDSNKTGTAFGGSIGWQLTPRVAIQSSGQWLDRGGGADAFAVAFKAQADLFPTLRAHPFIEGGLGLYHASFDSMAARMPPFYQRRMNTGLNGPVETAAFTDPACVLGGGLNIGVTRHLMVRPNVEAMVVARHSRTYVVTTVAVHLAYRFEHHPVTQSRRAK